MPKQIELPRKALRDIGGADLATVLRGQPTVGTFGRQTEDGYVWECVLVKFPDSCQTDAEKAQFLEELKRLTA